MSLAFYWHNLFYIANINFKHFKSLILLTLHESFYYQGTNFSNNLKKTKLDFYLILYTNREIPLILNTKNMEKIKELEGDMK